MLSNIAGWTLSVLLVLLCWLPLMIRKGPSFALAVATVLSFVFPVWLTVDIAGLPFNIRTTVICVALLGYVVHPEGRIISSLTMLDVCVAMLCLAHIASDSLADGFTAVLPFRAYGEWVLPYVAGRFAIRNKDDLYRIAPWAGAILLIVGFAAVTESLTRINLFELVFGNRPQEMAGRNAGRFGFKRAFGPTMHPLFFGMLIAVLTPWVVCLWKTADSGWNKTLAIWAGAFAIAGIVSTVSRTPVVTVLVAALLLMTIRFKSLRLPIGLLGTIAVLIMAMFPMQVTDTVSRLTGGGDRPQLVEIDGKAVVSSSSRSRLLLFSIYREALIKAGPFGYGSKAVSSFPLDIPCMQGKFKSANLFEMVDNAYILVTLRFGWLGGACLVIMFLTAIITGLSFVTDRSVSLLPTACACLIAVMSCFSFFLVWLNYDFGLPLLWTIGIISGLASARVSPRMNSSFKRV